ncbi:MAG: hypothetical protein AB7K63_19495 [Vicinamibacterales bacterium]
MHRYLSRSPARRVLLTATLFTCGGCNEVPLWTSEPVPLLRAVAEDRAPLVVEWAEGGADLNEPLSVSGAGLPHEGTDRELATPIDIAVRYGHRSTALLLVQFGAEVGAAGPALLCMVVLSGSPAEVTALRERGVRADASTYCPREDSTLADLAHRNSAEMEALIAGVPGSVR